MIRYVLIAVVALVLLAGGLVASQVVKVGDLLGQNGSGRAAAAPTPGSIPYQMPEHIVNLADKTGYRYLKIQVTLEFADPSHRPGELSGDALTQSEAVLSQTLMPYGPASDDFLITTLSQKTADELLTADGKETLRQQLLAGFRDRIPAPPLQQLYFTEFVIQ
jgi:flagellar FliL protein